MKCLPFICLLIPFLASAQVQDSTVQSKPAVPLFVQNDDDPPIQIIDGKYYQGNQRLAGFQYVSLINRDPMAAALYQSGRKKKVTGVVLTSVGGGIGGIGLLFALVGLSLRSNNSSSFYGGYNQNSNYDGVVGVGVGMAAVGLGMAAISISNIKKGKKMQQEAAEVYNQNLRNRKMSLNVIGSPTKIGLALRF